ncbi:MAG: CPBP family intramembrane metalloprotease [Dehalococcoidia bacterium]|nr:MAG: CPBP family intramembrane metalloprotease [Dehalococcoidia bacterium]
MRRFSPSTLVFFGLVLLNAVLAAITSLLPQGMETVDGAATISPAIAAVINSAVVLLFYGGLGYVGLRLSRKLGYPDLLDPKVTTRQRFIIPCISGLWIGLVFIVGDGIFNRFHSLGPLPHPPFPTSLLASFSAGIGEEMVFRLFFIPFLVWLISSVALKGAQKNAVFLVATFFSATFFAASHIPSVMIMMGNPSFAAIPTALLTEIFMLNGLLSIVAAHFLRTRGYLAAVTVHTSADIVWHVIWGLLR